jgi:hypothetical protein
MVVNFGRNIHEYPDIELPYLFPYIGSAVLSNVADPKGIASNINELSFEERTKVAERADFDASTARAARQYENNGDHKSCINKWRDIFGDEFPEYE